MVQWLGIRASTEGDVGSIPDWETKIPQASWPGQKKKKFYLNVKIPLFQLCQFSLTVAEWEENTEKNNLMYKMTF